MHAAITPRSDSSGGVYTLEEEEERIRREFNINY